MFLSKRNGVYYLWYDGENGNRRKNSTRCKEKKSALEFLRSFHRPDAAITVSQSPTLSEFYSSLRDYLVSTHRAPTVELYDKAWKHFREGAGEIRLTEVTSFHFDRYKIKRLRTLSPVPVNIELRALMSSFIFGVRWKHLLANPFAGLPLVILQEIRPVHSGE